MTASSKAQGNNNKFAMFSTAPSSYPSFFTNSIESNERASNSTVDAYAGLVLQLLSPPEACVNPSLGPYVCSILRNYLGSCTLEEIPETGSILELLVEQCIMNIFSARNALEMIFTSVKTGIVDHSLLKCEEPTSRFQNGAFSLDDDLDMINSISQMMKEAGIIDEDLAADEKTDGFYSHCFEIKQTDNIFFGANKIQNEWNPSSDPLHQPTSLIPTDLLKDLKESTTLETDLKSYATEVFSSVPQCRDTTEIESPSLSNSQEESSLQDTSEENQVTAKDLAASLFHPSRTRSKSVPNESAAYEKVPNHSESPSSFKQSELQSTIDILLSMNSMLSEEAVMAAATMSQLDVNLAQYLIESAMSAPPVCRHMLNDGCYRSDCQYTHNIEDHTCLFWLRGRCGKGSTKCRFLHGFSERLLENINQRPRSASFNPSSSTGTSRYSKAKSVWNNSDSNSQVYKRKAYLSPSDDAKSQPSESASFSFASVASKGYRQSLSFSPKEVQKTSFPKEIWNPSYDRSKDYFLISDPLQRFHEVSQASGDRNEVIDLNYQSIKSFPIVLNYNLPKRLKYCKEGVWLLAGNMNQTHKPAYLRSIANLEKAVIDYVREKGYNFIPGKEKSGMFILKVMF